MNIIHLRQTTLLFSGLFIVIGMACNAIFYWDFASGMVSGIIYVALGLGFDGFKVLLLPMAFIFFVVLQRPFIALFCVFAWACLTAISLIAAYGFFTTVQDSAERQNLIESAHYQMLNQTLQNSREDSERYAPYATIDIALLESQVQQLQADIRGHQNHPYFNEQNPVNKQRLQQAIDAIQAELEPLLVQLRGAKAYQAAAQSREQALAELSLLNTQQVSDEVINPMFTAMGKQFDMEGEEVKRAVLTFTAFATELLGTFAALVAVMLFHNQTQAYPNTSSVSNQNRPMDKQLGKQHRSSPAIPKSQQAGFNGVWSQNIPVKVNTDIPKW